MKGIFAHWPNRITAMRFVGALVLFLGFALMGDLQPQDDLQIFGTRIAMRTALKISFWLFVLVAATDFLDGYLARSGGHVSVFGRIADPFVDKVLVLGVMIFMAVMPWSRKYIPAWFVVIILSRELLVTGLRGYIESIGREFSADSFGKFKMVVQCMALGGVMFLPAHEWSSGFESALNLLVRTLVVVTLITTLGSGFSYVLKTKRILDEEDA